MSKRKRKAKEEPEKQDHLDGWDPKVGGVLKGSTKFTKPPCPIGSQGYHQYEKLEGTRRCRIWSCRLYQRTLGINRRTGNVRERCA